MTRKCGSSRFAHSSLPTLSYPTFCLIQPQSSSATNKFPNPKTLIVLYAWLGALEPHLDKFRQIYLDKGYDILTIRSKASDTLLPPFGSQVLAEKTYDFLARNYHQYDSIVFHAFSVGGYLMGELFVQFEQNAQIYSKISPRISGIIYDSPVDFDQIELGIARTLTNRPHLQWIIIALMKIYFTLFHNFTFKHYKASSAMIHSNPQKYPTLIFFSKVDVIVNWEHMRTLVGAWRKMGVRVWDKCWDQSVHVGHYVRHPQDYEQLLNEFLNQIFNKDQM